MKIKIKNNIHESLKRSKASHLFKINYEDQFTLHC